MIYITNTGLVLQGGFVLVIDEWTVSSRRNSFYLTFFFFLCFLFKQVHIGSHTFTYDLVFGNNGLPFSEIYHRCVAPLVEDLFKGYNATILAYGQV